MKTTLEKIFDRFSCSLLIDQEGNIEFLNKNFKMLMADFEAESLYELCHGQFNRDYYERILTHVIAGNTWRDEIHFYNGTEEGFWLDLAIAPYEDKVMLTGLDTSGRKKNESLIKEQEKQLFVQSQFSALGEMASGVAHEINNPLAVISASTFYLKEMIESEEVELDIFREIATDIDETVVRISRIIQGLRNIARDPSSDEFEIVALSKIVEDVLPLCTEKFKGRGIDFTVDFPDELLEMRCEILAIQLSQVLLNLLNNSFDEMEEKKNPWIKVIADYDEVEDFVTIKVIDCGKGIPEDIQEKIFNPFFTQKDIGKGTGLGLSLSRSILQRHKGELYIDKDCENTCFVMVFPTMRCGNKKRKAS